MGRKVYFNSDNKLVVETDNCTICGDNDIIFDLSGGDYSISPTDVAKLMEIIQGKKLIKEERYDEWTTHCSFTSIRLEKDNDKSLVEELKLMQFINETTNKRERELEEKNKELEIKIDKLLREKEKGKVDIPIKEKFMKWLKR